MELPASNGDAPMVIDERAVRNSERFLRMSVSVGGAEEAPATAKIPGLDAFFPPEWRFSDGATPVWVSGYRVFLAPARQLAPPIQKRAMVFGSKVIFTLLDLTYAKAGAFKLAEWQGSDLTFTLDAPTLQANFTGACMLILTPQRGNEPRTRAEIERVTGLIRALSGRNAAYDLAFQYVCESNGKVTLFTNSVDHPRTHRIPTITHRGINDLQDASARILALELTYREKIEFALDWFNSGAEASGNVGFVSRWVGLEVLGVPSGTNVAPINDYLSEAYGIPRKEAAERFMVGRLQGIRNAIVHKGARPWIPWYLQDVDALFVDVLHQVLALPCRSVAERSLESHPVAEAILAAGSIGGGGMPGR